MYKLYKKQTDHKIFIEILNKQSYLTICGYLRKLSFVWLGQSSILEHFENLLNDLERSSIHAPSSIFININAKDKTFNAIVFTDTIGWAKEEGSETMTSLDFILEINKDILDEIIYNNEGYYKDLEQLAKGA